MNTDMLTPDHTISAGLLMARAHRMARYERDLGRCGAHGILCPAMPLGDVGAWRARVAASLPAKAGELTYAEYLAIALRWMWAEAKSRRSWRMAA